MTELLIAMGLIAGVVAAHEIGFRLGSLTRSADEPLDRQVGLVRASTAALVGFLIGFAFSGAASRFIDRQDLIVKEANALGTAYLRADVIAEPQRGDLKGALKEYTADRVALLGREGGDQVEPLLANARGLHERMWKSAIDATRGNAPLMAVVLPPINEVIDLHSIHLAMARRHLPSPIMTVLLATAAIGVGMIGFGNGRVGRTIFRARRRLRSGSCGRFVDDHRPGLSLDRYHQGQQSPGRGNLGGNEMSMARARAADVENAP